MSEINSLATLSRYVAGLDFSNLPPNVVDYTKLLVADHVISAVAGYVYNHDFSMAITKIVTEEAGNGCCRVLFCDKSVSPAAAAFINAVYCHGADIDDGHREAEAHPGVAVIAAVLACAEDVGASGQDVITALVAGYEVFVRVAKSILPSHLHRGFHTTGTVGAIAAAAACAKLMRLDSAAIERAISLACTQASGLLVVCESGQAAKPINPGRAAQTGVLCAKLSQVGTDAPEHVFESAKGFARAFSDTYHPEPLTHQLGESYAIMDTYVKLYPSCRHTHAAIEAIKQFTRLYGPISASDEITICTYPIAVDIVGHQVSPDTIGDVKFSLPYVAACMILQGSYSLEDLRHFKARKSTVSPLAQKLNIVSDSAFDDLPRGIRGAQIVVTKSNGETKSSYVSIARGEGNDRIGWNELSEKADGCCAAVLDSKEQARLIEYYCGMDGMSKFAHIDISLIDRM